jgi:hypothetical protein
VKRIYLVLIYEPQCVGAVRKLPHLEEEKSRGALKRKQELGSSSVDDHLPGTTTRRAGGKERDSLSGLTSWSL